jgi:hypothetical protein
MRSMLGWAGALAVVCFARQARAEGGFNYDLSTGEVLQLPLGDMAFSTYARPSTTSLLMPYATTGRAMGLVRPILGAWETAIHGMYGKLVFGVLGRLGGGGRDSAPDTTGSGSYANGDTLAFWTVAGEVGARIDVSHIQFKVTGIFGYQEFSVDLEGYGLTSTGARATTYTAHARTFLAEGRIGAQYVAHLTREAAFTVGVFAGFDAYPAGGVVGGLTVAFRWLDERSQ